MPTAVTNRLVWVVDDSHLDAERTRRVLSQECSVEVFLDGSAALERLASASTAPDVMVLDWLMPGITGVDVCRFLRSEQGGYPEVGVLLLTTHRPTLTSLAVAVASRVQVVLLLVVTVIVVAWPVDPGREDFTVKLVPESRVT